MLRQAVLAASQSATMRTVATSTPLTKGVVRRFVAGENVVDAVNAAAALAAMGLHCSLDYLGEHTQDQEQANETARSYLRLLGGLADADLADRAEVSIKLSAIGQELESDGPQIALDHLRTISAAAIEVGTSVTVDMEDHTTTDATLEVIQALRKDFPNTGAVLQAYLKRTEQDCRDLSYEGSRVRLCKGAYAEPESVAYSTSQEVDLSYVRCLKILMAGKGFPMIATHDPRLVEIAAAIAVRTDRERGSYEYQMLYGVRPDEQRRLAATGERVRVYVPYGTEWYPYLVRRMAEKPANLALFLRALTSTS